MTVTVQEIVNALRRSPCLDGHALSYRIEREGIAPPDGWVLVPNVAPKPEPKL